MKKKLKNKKKQSKMTLAVKNRIELLTLYVKFTKRAGGLDGQLARLEKEIEELKKWK